MNEKKKGLWLVVHFPNGSFEGKMNLEVKGSMLLSAGAAKEVIDSIELGLDKCSKEL